MICKRCSKTLKRVRRKSWQRLLPGSRRFACTNCGRRYLIFLDLLCEYCNHALKSVPRGRLLRLLPGSAKYACTHCPSRFLSFLGVLFELGDEPRRPVERYFGKQMWPHQAQRRPNAENKAVNDLLRDSQVKDPSRPKDVQPSVAEAAGNFRQLHEQAVQMGGRRAVRVNGQRPAAVHLSIVKKRPY